MMLRVFDRSCWQQTVTGIVLTNNSFKNFVLFFLQFERFGPHGFTLRQLIQVRKIAPTNLRHRKTRRKNQLAFLRSQQTFYHAIPSQHKQCRRSLL